jgi:D-glycerate 3-kinase
MVSPARHPASQPAIDPALDRQWLQPLMEEIARLGASGQRPVVALNGPVGAGKSTLAAVLRQRAAAQGLGLAVASIDDFYLPWEARRRALAGNPFGVSRVPPGSHDVELAVACLQEWRNGGLLRLPRFDKTLLGGMGDRAGVVWLKADVLLLEGWLLGCRPLGSSRLAELQAHGLPGLSRDEQAWVSRSDQELKAYQPLWEQCSQLWLLRPLSWSLPRRWRFQAEARQRRRGAPWLPVDALDRLVRSSLCSLPPASYQDPLIHKAAGLAVLDGRRRWCDGWVRTVSPAAGSGRDRDDQLSPSSPSSSTG